MEKSEFRAVIKHLYLKGLKPKEIKAELDKVHGTSAPVFATVYNWVSEFKRGRTSTNDEHRSGRPVEVTSSEMIVKIHDMVLSDRRIKVREIVEATGISQGSVFNFARKIGFEKNLGKMGAAFALNARVHTCAVSMAKIAELKFELLQHPPYSPDLVPSDFFLFPNLKKWLGAENDSRRTRRSSPKQMPISTTFRNPTFRTA